MGLLEESVQAYRELVLKNCKEEVFATIAHLKATRKNSAIVFSDRGWLFDFVVYRPDLRFVERNVLLAQEYKVGWIAKEQIWRWIEEAAGEYIPQTLPDLPDKEGGPWCAVKIADQYFCVGCRSLHEGDPLTQGEVSYLQDQLDECEACEDCQCQL